CQLRPAETCDLETEGFSTRAAEDFHGATAAGIALRSLRAMQKQNKIGLSGSFGVFYAGRLIAHFYTEHGFSLGSTPVATVDPTEAVSLANDIVAPAKTARISL